MRRKRSKADLVSISFDPTKNEEGKEKEIQPIEQNIRTPTAYLKMSCYYNESDHSLVIKIDQAKFVFLFFFFLKKKKKIK
mgnify:CR=1 FL=1